VSFLCSLVTPSIRSRARHRRTNRPRGGGGTVATLSPCPLATVSRPSRFSRSAVGSRRARVRRWGQNEELVETRRTRQAVGHGRSLLVEAQANGGTFPPGSAFKFRSQIPRRQAALWNGFFSARIKHKLGGTRPPPSRLAPQSEQSAPLLAVLRREPPFALSARNSHATGCSPTTTAHQNKTHLWQATRR